MRMNCFCFSLVVPGVLNFILSGEMRMHLPEREGVIAKSNPGSSTPAAIGTATTL